MDARLTDLKVLYAVCPGGEEAVLKTVELKGFASSNLVYRAIFFKYLR